MNSQQLTKGVYLVWQKSQRKGVDHYGVLDVGNCLGIAQADGIRPVVIHQAPPAITVDTIENSGPWTIVASSSNIQQSCHTFWQACQIPDYNCITNNCEHFARSVVLGQRESKQVQNVVVAGVLVLGLIGLSRNA